MPWPISDLLDRTLRSFGTPTTVRGVEVVFERWHEVVGQAMAERTRPLQIDRASLVVGCDEPAVASHLRFLAPQLLERLCELAGDSRINRIEVRVQRQPKKAPH